MADLLRRGHCDVLLGNRIRTRREALEGGMPLDKYVANRLLTFVENLWLGQNLGEWHSGMRGYRISVPVRYSPRREARVDAPRPDRLF